MMMVNCWFWRLLFCLFFVVVKVFVVIYVVEEEEAKKEVYMNKRVSKDDS